MLHVTNGSIAVSRLHDLGVPGRIIPWDDVLHEGPVRAGLSVDELRHERADFLGREWNDVETDLRSGWDRFENRGESTWEQIRDAVRDAWNRVRH